MATDAEKVKTPMATETEKNRVPTAAPVTDSALYASVVSVDAILNDGITPNSVTVRVLNASAEPLTLGSDAELILSFDMGPTTVAYALATEGQVHGFEVAIGDVSRWRVTPRPTFNSPTTWSIKPRGESIVLAPQEGLELVISSIVTGHPSGGTNLYLDYRDVGGRDGRLIVRLEKTELAFDRGGTTDEDPTVVERFLYDAAYLLEIDQAALADLRKARAAEAFEVAQAERAAAAAKAAEAKRIAAKIEAIVGDDDDESVHVMQLDGSGYVDLGAGIQLEAPFTMEAWIYTRYTGGLQPILGGKSRDNRGPSLMVTNVRGLLLGFNSHAGWTEIYQQNIIRDNVWTHVACSFDGREATLFVDGVEQLRNALEHLSGDVLPVSFIGWDMERSDLHWPGGMADVRIWSIVRTAAELKSTMNVRLTGDEEGLVGYWPLNQINKGTVKDFSASGCDGAAKQDASVVAEGGSSIPLKAPPIPVVEPPLPPPPPPLTDLAKAGPLDLFGAPPLDEPGFLAPAVGVLVRSEQCWHSQGVLPGQLLYSTGLAPSESTSIVVERTSLADDTVAELGDVVAAETRAQASAGTSRFELTRALPTPTATRTGGARGLGERNNRDIASRTQRQASQVRKRLPWVSEGASSDAGMRVVTNHSQVHAMTAQYFAAVNEYRVVTRATQYERLLFVPMKQLSMSDPRVAERYQLGLWDLQQQRRWARGPAAAPAPERVAEIVGAGAAAPVDTERASGFVTLRIAGEPVYTIPLLRPRLTKMSWRFLANEDDEFWFQASSCEAEDDEGRLKPALSGFWFGRLDADGTLAKKVEINVPEDRRGGWRELELAFPDVPLWQRPTSLGCDFSIKPRFFRSQTPGTAAVTGDSSYTNYELNGVWSRLDLPAKYLAVRVEIADRVQVVFHPRVRHVPPLPRQMSPRMVFQETMSTAGGWHGPYEVWLLRRSDPLPRLEVTLHFSDGVQEDTFTHIMDYSPAWSLDNQPLFDFDSAAPVRSATASQQPTAGAAADPADSAMPTVPLQLASDSLFGSQLVWTNTPAGDWRRRLRGLTYQGQVIDDLIDPTPVAVIDNYVGFPWRFDDDLDKLDWLLKMQLLDRDFRAWLKDHGYSDTDVDLSRASRALKRDYLDQGLPQGDEGRLEVVVPIPTGGVMADVILGSSNRADREDTETT